MGGCQPEVPGRAVYEDPVHALTLTVEPAAELTRVPPVLRVHLGWRDPGAAAAASPAMAESVVLAEGSLGKSQLRQLASGELSRAFEERLVPTVRWQAADGHLVLAPTRALDLGVSYTVASGLLDFAAELTVESEPSAPVLERLWPPVGHDGALGAALWCGSEPLPQLSFEQALAPDGPAGSFRTAASSVGRWANGAAPGGCVRFMPHAMVESTMPATAAGGAGDAADTPGGAAGSVPPPAVAAAGAPWSAYLDPSPFGMGAAAPEVAACACDGEEQPFGPGCALVADDRMVVRTPDEPLLWIVTLANRQWTVATSPGESYLVHPLPIGATFRLELEVLDTRGASQHATHEVGTFPPMAHVVLNEVLANPVGPEPAQEWIELYNDGLAPAHLLGAELVDAGGVTTLPDAQLPPGAFALLVPEEFDEASEFDVPPADGTLLVRVPALGKNGLSNEGEPLLLRGADGSPWSRFPADPPPRSGQSVVRVEPRALDDAVDAFMRAAGGPTPGRPNGAAR